MSEGDFAVLDANATDGTGAFRLPSPDPDGDGVTSYSVYSRALGTPGGSSTTTTCATDPTTGEILCSDLSMVLVRDSGKSKFTNVSRELLYARFTSSSSTWSRSSSGSTSSVCSRSLR